MSSINNSPINNKDGYDQWSAFYDSYPNPTVAMDERFFPGFWRHHTGKKILEIGCGTGRHTQKLARCKNQITALDLSPGMLKVAREKISSADVTFIEADFLSSENLDSDYDLILESLVLEHLPDLNLFFEKASRSLKTGGDLYLSEIHPVRAEQGILAHFKGEDGDDVHLTSFPHRTEHLISAAEKSGLALLHQAEVRGDLELAKLNPKWSKYQDQPMILILHFVKV